MKMRVLIAEDENKLADALVQILAKSKITADAAYNGIDALDNALSGIYDVIVLDIMMPGMDGIEVLRQDTCRGYANARAHVHRQGRDIRQGAWT